MRREIDGADGWRYNPEEVHPAVFRRRSASRTDGDERRARWEALYRAMMNELRGRNLAHVGCTIGLTLGLALGLVTALLIVTLVRGDSAINWATVAWFGLTFALGVVGYWAGGQFSKRLWGDEMEARRSRE